MNLEQLAFFQFTDIDFYRHADCLRLRARHPRLDKWYGRHTHTDTAYDRMGGRAGGFLKTGLKSRGPYPAATLGDVESLQRWYREHFPEMLEL